MTTGIEVIKMETGPRVYDTYLGYGVYAGHDDIQWWLKTERDGQTHEIALTIDEVNAFVTYINTTNARRHG